MTSQSTASLLSLGPLAAVALLLGALGPFASYVGWATTYELGRPIWPAICAGTLGCAAATLCIRVSSSHEARRALLVSVGLLTAPLLLGQWAPGLIMVGSIGAAALIPIFLVAIGLSLARGPHAAAGVAGLVACGPLSWLLAAVIRDLVSRSLHRLTLAHVALGIGIIAMAGAAAAAWLPQWPVPPPEPDKLPAPGLKSFLSLGSSLMLAIMSNVDLDSLNRDTVSGLALFSIQALGLPIASALCLLPFSFRHRPVLYLAVAILGRFLVALASVTMR